MKNSLNYLVIFLVSITLLGFVAIAVYSFYLSVYTDQPILSERLTFIANALVGLVGGIVASAFGVELPPPKPDIKTTRYIQKMSNMGNLVLTGKLKADDTASNSKLIFGNIYAWIYFIIGLTAIAIWALDTSTVAVVDNLATVSFGLILVIVKNYLE